MACYESNCHNVILTLTRTYQWYFRSIIGSKSLQYHGPQRYFKMWVIFIKVKSTNLILDRMFWYIFLWIRHSIVHIFPVLVNWSGSFSVLVECSTWVWLVQIMVWTFNRIIVDVCLSYNILWYYLTVYIERSFPLLEKVILQHKWSLVAGKFTAYTGFKFLTENKSSHKYRVTSQVTPKAG